MTVAVQFFIWECLFPIFGVGSLQCRICRLLWAGEPARQWTHFVAWFPGQYLINALFFNANVIRRIRKEVGRKFRYSKLKGTMPWDFRLLAFFMNQFPPSPWVYHKGRFKFFWKFAEIFSVQSAPPVSVDTGGKWKIFNQKNFNYFVWTPLGGIVNIYINFCLQIHFKYNKINK